MFSGSWTSESGTHPTSFEATQAPISKRAYVDRSTNYVDWGVFGGQNVDAGARNRRSWTGWTVTLTLPR